MAQCWYCYSNNFCYYCLLVPRVCADTKIAIPFRSESSGIGWKKKKLMALCLTRDKEDGGHQAVHVHVVSNLEFPSTYMLPNMQPNL